MTDAEIRALILRLICDIAPEADPATAHDQDHIREAFDLDSMDFINLVTAIHERTKINIPESDYNKIFVQGGSSWVSNPVSKAVPRQERWEDPRAITPALTRLNVEGLW